MEDPSELPLFQKISFASGTITVLLGLIGVIGIVLSDYRLTSVGQAFTPIAFSTAVMLIVLGSVLLIQPCGSRHAWQKSVLALLLASLALLMFLEGVAGILGSHTPVEDFLVHTSGTVFSGTASHMSPVTAFLLGSAFLALVLLQTKKQTPQKDDAVGILGTGILLSGIMFVSGYIYGNPILYGTPVIPIALITSVALCSTGLGILASAGPGAVPSRFFIGRSFRARLLRQFFPLTIALVITQNFLDWFLAWHLSISNVLVISAGLAAFCLITALAVFHAAEMLGGQITIEESRRLHAEDALKKSESQYRSILENMQDGYFRIDPDGIIIMANHSAARMYQYPSAESMLGICAEALFHRRDDLDYVSQYLEKNGTIADYVAEWRKKDGTIFWVSLNARTIYDEMGAANGAECVARDISDRRKLEESLIASEKRYRLLYSSMAQGVIYQDADGRIIDANPAAETILGLSRDQMLGRTSTDSCWNSVHEDGSAFPGELHPAMLALKSGRPEKAILGVFNDREGKYRWIQVNAVPLFQDGTDHPVQVFTSFEDITVLKTAQDTLELKEDLIHRTGEIAKVGGWEFDAVSGDGTWTDEVARIHDLDPAEPTNMAKGISFYTPESRKTIEAAIRNALNLATPYDLELEMITAAGRHKWVRTKGIPVTEDGRVVKVRGSFQDITDRKTIEDSLRESQARLDLALRSAAMGTWYWDTIEDRRYFDDQTCRILGIDPEHFTGTAKEFFSRVHPDDHDMIKQGLSLTIEKDAPYHPEYRVIWPDGSIHFIAARGKLMRDAEGRPWKINGVIWDITEQKAAEEKLRQSEVKTRFLYESIHDAYVSVDMDGRIGVYNKAYRDMLGYTDDELRRMTYKDFTPEKWHSFENRIVEEQILPRGYSDVYEKEYRRKDGTVFPVELRTFLIRNAAGAPVGLWAIVRDITERKREEELLRQSETRFRSLIQNSSDIIRILDAGGIIQYDSPSSERILGYPGGFFIGKNPLDFTHPEDRERVRQDLLAIKTHRNTGSPAEFRIQKKDGSYIYVESVASNLLDSSEIQGIVITMRPIHERKLAEISLRESEERFRQIFDNAYDAIFMTEATPAGMPGRFLDANRVMCSRLGYSREDLLTMNALEIHSPQDATMITGHMMDLFTRGETSFESTHITKSSSLIPVELTAHLIRAGERSAIIWVARDITQRKQEEKALRLANQKLQLMNIVAWHDIQNKVTGLRGYVELSKDMVTDPRAREFIEREEDGLKAIYEHIQYTKEYQEIGKEPLQWVNIPSIIRQSISSIDRKEVTITLNLDHLEIYCDPIIRKVFSHLVENSILYGKTVSRIQISCRESSDHLTILYEDNGEGIPTSLKKSIFIRDVAKGSGFSLFFIHDILELSGMGIRETGTPGDGVRFEISVPRNIYRLFPEDNPPL